MGAIRDRSILIACIGAGSAIAAAFAKPICETLFPGSPAPRPGLAAIAPADPSPITPTPNTIEGAWKQYILSEDEGDVYLGTLVVGRSKGEYVISPRTQTEGERMQDSIGVFDVAFDGRVWSFNSNWGDGEVGNFELKRVSPTVFEGEIRVAGALSNRTRFVKIE
jgi:hypothetical protein